MKTKICIILALSCVGIFQLQAQEQIESPLITFVSNKADDFKKVNQAFEDMQLSISRLSNRMIWLQQRLKEAAKQENADKEKYQTELADLIKKRGDLLQTSRKLLRPL